MWHNPPRLLRLKTVGQVRVRHIRPSFVPGPPHSLGICCLRVTSPPHYRSAAEGGNCGTRAL